MSKNNKPPSLISLIAFGNPAGFAVMVIVAGIILITLADLLASLGPNQ